VASQVELEAQRYVPALPVLSGGCKLKEIWSLTICWANAPWESANEETQRPC